MLDFSPKNILVPIDLSEISENSILCARSLAQAYKAKLFIYYVIENMETTLGYMPSMYVDQLDLIDLHMRNEAEKYFNHIKNKFFNNFDNVSMHIDKGIVFKKIMEFVLENKIDLIVISTHRKNILEGFMLGSTTDKLLRILKKPILVLND